MSYCTPCPPCDTNFPLLCEPLETTADGKRLVVEDSAACQKTIQSPVTQQVLKTDGAGNLTWTNGANNTVLGKDSTGKVEFVPSVNNILQAGPVDLGSQPLTTNGTIATSGSIACKLLDVYNPSGPAGIEVGGVGTAFIDLKSPNPDDNDIRLGTNGTGGFLSTSNNGNIIIDPGTGSVGIAIGTPEARLHVVRGANIFGSAQFAGSQETSFFHNSVDEHTYIRGGKTTSNVYLNDTSTGFTSVGSGGLIVNGTIFATGNSSKIGYTSGGSVTQGAGAKTNSVTLNRPTGIIITDNASLANNTAVAFTLNNSVIESTDIVLVSHISGGTLGSYSFTAAPATGNAAIVIRNITPAGSLSEALTLRFIVIKSVNA
jgi:hypothetical protein